MYVQVQAMRGRAILFIDDIHNLVPAGGAGVSAHAPRIRPVPEPHAFAAVVHGVEGGKADYVFVTAALESLVRVYACVCVCVCHRVPP